MTVLADHHDAVARQLAGRPDTRFDDLDLTFGPGGVAWFDTTIDRHVEVGDHTIVLLRPHADHSRPLVFHRSRFGFACPPRLSERFVWNDLSRMPAGRE